MKKLLILVLLLIATPVYAYTIKSGDTLNEIAEEFNTTIEHILKFNEIADINLIYTGDILQLFNLEPKQDADTFGAIKSFRPSGYESTLASSLAEGGNETTLVVNSITLPDNTSLASTSFGDLLILTIGEGDNEEKIAINDLNPSTKTFTIESRGLEYGRWASSTSNILQHLPGERVYISNDDHWIYQQLPDIESDETFFGTKTFDNYPQIADANIPPTAQAEFATKKYIDDTAIQGAATSTESVLGLVELGVREELAAGTASSTTGAPLVALVKFASSTPGSNATEQIVISESDGKLNQTWLDLTESFGFTGDNTHSGQNTFSNATSTFSGDIFSNTNVISLVASTTFTGFQTPQPVYIATTSSAEAGGALIVDGNVQDTLDFIGFAITSASSGETVYVQTDGITDGFTGLTKGAKYYVQDAVGTIGTSVGTYEVLVGIAISATEILIEKGKDQLVGSDSVSCDGAGTSCTDTSPMPSFANYAVINCSYSLSQTPAADDFGEGDIIIYRNGKTAGTSKYADATSNVWAKCEMALSENVITVTNTSSNATNMAGTIYYYR